MSDLIDRQAAISAICNACGKIDCDKMDKCEKLQLPPANSSETPNNSDTISRQAAIDICTSAIDLWSGQLGEGALVAVRNKIAELPPALGTNLAEVGTDCISREQAIGALKDWYDGMIISSFRGIAKVIDALPPVQPETAKRIVGKSRDGMTLWYQCDMCNEPVDAQDNYCRGCGRRLIDG